MKNEADIFRIVFCSGRRPMVQVSIKFEVSPMGTSEILGDQIWNGPIEFLEVLSKQLWFIRCRRQHLCPIEQRRYSRFTSVQNNICNLPKVPRATFLESEGLFCFISICKFGSFKNPSAMITRLSELYFRFRFIQLVQRKKVISKNYGSSRSS